jgi:hypothetical protein
VHLAVRKRKELMEHEFPDRLSNELTKYKTWALTALVYSWRSAFKSFAGIGFVDAVAVDSKLSSIEDFLLPRDLCQAISC